MIEKNLNIALVDDDNDDRTLFELAISRIGIPSQLKMFKSGIELITYIRDPAIRRPDLLFLDLNMPNMDGLECLKEIKQDPGLRDITVIIYSTSCSEKDIEATFLEGANIYLNKPSDFNDLKKALKRILALDWQYQNSTLNRDNFLFRL
ncbi:response regulator [Lacinutrix neustonica]|uniref:Response regulator n=1 Tax=Lacinutrix neustonica TaxID=2980107 RepID=A0A9E8MXF9_9FLAO|nr:response regulator [Lacinutrix neustonica]WAC03146.1 response regulator [Lacinutrix neustonica]